MRHVSLTCKNHPDLRWSAKEIAVNSDGTYNGSRSIFFVGRLMTYEDGSPILLSDKSGLDCTRYDESGPVAECKCSARDLIRSPEDALLKAAYDESERKRAKRAAYVKEVTKPLYAAVEALGYKINKWSELRQGDDLIFRSGGGVHFVVRKAIHIGHLKEVEPLAREIFATLGMEFDVKPSTVELWLKDLNR